MFQTHSGARPKWRPIGTQALISLNICVFMLQLLWGGTDSPAMLAAMGAMVASRIDDGEWWRLFSCTVLHGSFMHIALNSYVLFILGSFVERVLGTGRFLVLYVASGIVASIGSYFWTEVVSVGASGAVFGLLAAQGVLAYFPRGLLPEAILPGARRAAAMNLLLNIGISFMPNIDAAAHFAGACAGGVLVLTGIVTPKVSTPPRQQWQLARMWLSSGVALSLVYAAIALFGVLQGKPWQHQSEIRFAARTIEPVQRQHWLPEFLPAPKQVTKGETETLILGDVYQMYSLGLSFLRLDAAAGGSSAFHQQVRAQLAAQSNLAAPPETIRVRGGRITCASQTLPNGLNAHTCILSDPPYVVTLDGAYWSGEENEERYQDLTREIASRWWSPVEAQ